MEKFERTIALLSLCESVLKTNVEISRQIDEFYLSPMLNEDEKIIIPQQLIDKMKSVDAMLIALGQKPLYTSLLNLA